MQIRVLLSFLLGTQLWAQYQEHTVPGARCLDSSPYRIFYRKANSKKVLIHLGGGGACWKKEDAMGLVRLCKSKVTPPPNKGVFAFNSNSPFADYSYIFLPYCSGDIFVGTHTKELSRKILHYQGRSNIEKSISYIRNNFSFIRSVNTFVIMGSSAGALGAFLNFDILSSLAPYESKKVLVADSPGLHFGDRVWEDMPEEMLDDVNVAFKHQGVILDKTQDTLSYLIKEICINHKNWTLGILQGTRDWVMSFMGKMSQSEHEELVASDEGIYEILKNQRDRCSSWSPKSAQHKFLSFNQTLNIRVNKGLTALQYLQQILNPNQMEQSSYLQSSLLD